MNPVADASISWSPHLQTQIQGVPVLSSLYPSHISFSYFTFPGAPYRIFLLFLPWIPCHFYLVVIEQQQQGCSPDWKNLPRLSKEPWRILIRGAN